MQRRSPAAGTRTCPCEVVLHACDSRLAAALCLARAPPIASTCILFSRCVGCYGRNRHQGQSECPRCVIVRPTRDPARADSTANSFLWEGAVPPLAAGVESEGRAVLKPTAPAVAWLEWAAGRRRSRKLCLVSVGVPALSSRPGVMFSRNKGTPTDKVDKLFEKYKVRQSPTFLLRHCISCPSRSLVYGAPFSRSPWAAAASVTSAVALPYWRAEMSRIGTSENVDEQYCCVPHPTPNTPQHARKIVTSVLSSPQIT